MRTLVSHRLDAETTQTVLAFIDRVTAVFSVRSVLLLGSRARGEFQSDSDADVVV